MFTRTRRLRSSKAMRDMVMEQVNWSWEKE